MSDSERWLSERSGADQLRLPSSRRRDKPQLSCNLCRRRKLRCDRQHPCGTCAIRGLGSSCAYLPTATSPSNGGQTQSSTSSVKIKARINKLENLVVDLMQKTKSSDSEHGLQPLSAAHTPVSASAPLSASDRFSERDDHAKSPADHGSMKLTTAGASYVSSTHWAAILDEIGELRDHFEKEDETYHVDGRSNPLPPDIPGPRLLYGCQKYATKEEILASVPQRPLVDRFVSQYFHAFEMAPGEHTQGIIPSHHESRPSANPKFSCHP